MGWVCFGNSELQNYRTRVTFWDSWAYPVLYTFQIRCIFAMGSAHELFKLDWRDHGLNASKAFRSLREDSNFCDVTIACEDGVLLCHNDVLFASSLLFKDILKKHGLTPVPRSDAKKIDKLVDYLASQCAA